MRNRWYLIDPKEKRGAVCRIPAISATVVASLLGLLRSRLDVYCPALHRL